MARSRHLGLWAFVLWAVCVAGVGGGYSGQVDMRPTGGTTSATSAAVQYTADPAVLSGRASDELRATSQVVALRPLFLIGVLLGLIGLAAILRRRTAGPDRCGAALCTRRHSISLRAPPLLRFA